MHYSDWNDGWGNGAWILMAIMMVLFWGGLIWLGVALFRRGPHMAAPHGHEVVAPPPSGPSPQDMLAERLARGEIEPDDYRLRLEALRNGRPETAGRR